MNYYEILQVSRDAGKDEILAAYQNLFRKYQDEAERKGGETTIIDEKLRKIKTAYEVLSDDVRRSAFDSSQNIAYDEKYIYDENYSSKLKRRSIATVLLIRLMPVILIAVVLGIYSLAYYWDDITRKEVSMPSTGVISKYASGKNVAPFEVIIPDDDESYYIKLIYINTDITAMTMFVKAGESIDVLVPLGRYELRYACGEKWYGEEYLFGKNTSYYKTDDIFDFTEDDEGYNGWTVELTYHTDGNLNSSEINDDEF